MLRKLPSQPNLEQLRKQAKELLAAYRAGAAAEPSFTLSDAQRVLAREYGYGSWARLKAFVDGANVARLAEAVKSGDAAQARALLRARPELARMDMAGNDEHRALHFAVLRRDAAMVRLLMRAGADARQGIFPHRDATTPYALARDRDYRDIVAAIEDEEQHRREEASCPNVTVSPVQERINEAIREGDNREARRLLEADESLIGACDREGGSALHAAAGVTNVEMVEWLLVRHANPRKQDLEGRTPLDRAALAARPRNDHAKRFRAVAHTLLYHGADLTIRGAVALNDGGRVRELVGADPGVLRRGIHWGNGGLLSLAVNHGHIEMVRLLLDLGADVDERTAIEELEEQTLSWGMPLWFAALAGEREIAELLLDRGADPNASVYASGWPLRNAYQNEPLRRLLIERGARPQPYMVAEAHDVEEARRMLQADAGEELAAELAWSAARHGCAAIVEMAVAPLSWAPDDRRWNWVLVQPIRGVGDDAKAEGFFAAMAVLLRRGIDVNAATRFGQTALHYAAARDTLSEGARTRFVTMLLDFGARFDLRDDLLGSTALGWACRWGRREMVEVLIARGAPVVEAGAQEWATPLAWAGKMGHSEIGARLASLASPRGL